MNENSSEYTGIVRVSSNDPRVLDLYADKNTNHFDLNENEYLLIYEDNKCVDKYKWQDNTHKQVVNKKMETIALGKIKPKNVEQTCAIDMLLDPSITVKIMTGGFGTGKSFLACATALQMLQSQQYDRILWIRNNIEVKDSNPIGFLKGDFKDKMLVWAMPLADHIGGVEELESYMARGMVEVWHLGFLRGRDIKRSIIFCSEAEHLTREHVQLLLGRVSEGSCLILEGDRKQIDARTFEKDNGLTAAIDKLKNQRLVSYVKLNESVRSDTAKLADLLD